MTFAVITPTIGTPDLAKCAESLKGQNCTHYIIIDGQDACADVNKILLEGGTSRNQKIIYLEENIGKGWYGHRAFAAASFLVNEDVLCYLDEDNWVEPSYIEDFQRVLNSGVSWAYTLRNIMNPHGEFICQDNCESLGKWPVVFDPNRQHIDTGCFAVPRTLAVQLGHNWYGQWGADRQFFKALLGSQAKGAYGCTGEHTLNYRLGSATSQANQEMFLRGNQMAREHYKGEYPWHNPRSETPKGQHLTYHTTTNQLS